eukprot:scaffold4740_cov21-Tisochrysis_lutea.AAC.2
MLANSRLRHLPCPAWAGLNVFIIPGTSMSDNSGEFSAKHSFPQPPQPPSHAQQQLNVEVPTNTGGAACRDGCSHAHCKICAVHAALNAVKFNVVHPVFDTLWIMLARITQTCASVMSCMLTRNTATCCLQVYVLHAHRDAQGSHAVFDHLCLFEVRLPILSMSTLTEPGYEHGSPVQ